MNKTNVFDYLLVFEELLSDCEVLAQDYWCSAVEMSSKNRHTGRDYRCLVVCVGYSREQRKKLSDRTGIPLSRIADAEIVFDNAGDITDFTDCVEAELAHNKDFFGRIKVYASEQKVPRRIFASSLEVIYAE